jgi:hypothetical protein
MHVYFEDFEPVVNHVNKGVIAECPYFKVEKLPLSSPVSACVEAKFSIIAVVSGGASCAGVTFKPGDFFLAPASLGKRRRCSPGAAEDEFGKRLSRHPVERHCDAWNGLFFVTSSSTPGATRCCC